MEFARPDVTLTDRFACFARRAVTDLSGAAAPLAGIDAERDVLVVVDMVNGFADGGTLYSPRIRGIRPAVADAMDAFHGCSRVMLRDAHTDDAAEFGHYPEHCVDDTEEAKLVGELAGRLVEGDTVIGKNSTNAMESDGFRRTFEGLVAAGRTRFTVVGDCTDICVMQSAMAMKSHLDERDLREAEVGVLLPATETFDQGVTNHDGDVMNIVSLYLLAANGIVLYSELG